MSKPGAGRKDRLTWARDRDAELLALYIRLTMERRADEEAWRRWEKPYFEACPENSVRHQNQGARAYLSNYLDAADASAEAADGHLGSTIGLRKANEAMTLNLKLMEGDVEGAERLSKRTGLSFDECLKIYSDLNILNTPSYLGGGLIQKTGDGQALAPSARAAMRDLDFAASAHASAMRGNGIDPCVTKGTTRPGDNAVPGRDGEGGTLAADSLW